MPAAMITLLDIAKANGSDGVAGLIDETARVHPEVVNIAARTIKGINYKTLVRTAVGRATGSFRAANSGSAPIKSVYENRLVETFYLEARWEADKAVADAFEDGAPAYIAMEAEGVMEAGDQKHTAHRQALGVRNHLGIRDAGRRRGRAERRGDRRRPGLANRSNGGGHLMLTPTGNLWTFLPSISGSEHVILTLTGDWTVTGGMEPNINCAEIPYTERSKLPANLIYISGTIYAWNTNALDAPGAAPVNAWANQWLVDCSPGHVGCGPDDITDRALSLRLAFADHRVSFRPPRGGRLTQGLGNPDPLGDATLIPNSALISACMSAMGISAMIPPSVDNVPPRRNIEWYGAHAPSELGQLLQDTGHVYAPYSGGGGQIFPLGAGGLPTIPSGRLISSVAASCVSRLPQTAIFTSAPNAVARTYTPAGGDLPGWEFVVQNPANNYKWDAIDSLGDDPLDQLRRGFPDAPEQDRRLLSSQFYKCIRLKGERFNILQSPILRDVLYPDGSTDQPHILAKIAVQGKDNAWVNQQTRINASTIDGVGNILVFDTRLGTVDGDDDERADLDAFFTPLADADLKPTYTVEDYNETDGKLYAVYGFVVGLGVGAISESAARAHLRGFDPSVGIYDIPDLRFVWLNDDTNNGDELAATALAAAEALLVSSPTCTTVEVRGILPCEIDGRINEVTFSQSGLKTTITLDGWATASQGRHSRRHGANSPPSSGGGGGGVSGDLVRQHSRTPAVARQRTQSQQLARGGAFARQVTPSSPVPPERTGLRRVFAKPTTAVDGVLNRWNGKTYSGKFNRDTSGDFANSDLGALAADEDCIISSPTALQIGVPIACDAGPVNADGKLLMAYTGGGGLFLVWLTKDGGIDGSTSTAATWTYTVKDEGGNTLATTRTPIQKRNIGSTNYANANTVGLATYVDGELWLLSALEEFMPGVQRCT